MILIKYEYYSFAVEKKEGSKEIKLLAACFCLGK